MLTAIARAAFAKLKRDVDMGWHYTKLYRYIDDVIEKTITRECSKILLAVKVKPAQFNAEAKAKDARKQARTKLASELRVAKTTLRKLNREIQNAEYIAEKKVEEHSKEKRKLQAHRILSARARLKSLKESERIASSKWALKFTCKESVNYPHPPIGLFIPNKDGLGIPAHPGIYFLWSGDTVMYVGQSINLASRLRLGNHHVLDSSHRISFLLFPLRELTWAENYYIGALRSPLNYGRASAHVRADSMLREK